MGIRWTIYCHIHIESGRRYIGLTKKTMMQRWNQHVFMASRKRGKGCAHFWAAIKKYGKDAFSHEVLEVCETLEAANLAEAKWINHFNSRDPQFGFNLVRGGAHIPHPVKNPWDRLEFREKMKKDVLPKLIAAGSSPEARVKSTIANSTQEARGKASENTKRQFSDSATRMKMSETVRTLHTIPEIAEKFNSGFKKYNAERSSRTHCKHGHEYTIENTGISVNGSRRCRRCATNRVSRKYHENTVCCKYGHEYIEGSFKLSKSGERICLQCVPVTHCKKGHEFSSENTFIDPVRRVRICMTCRRLRGRILDKQRRLKRRSATLTLSHDN